MPLNSLLQHLWHWNTMQHCSTFLPVKVAQIWWQMERACSRWKHLCFCTHFLFHCCRLRGAWWNTGKINSLARKASVFLLRSSHCFIWFIYLFLPDDDFSLFLFDMYVCIGWQVKHWKSQCTDCRWAVELKTVKQLIIFFIWSLTMNL